MPQLSETALVFIGGLVVFIAGAFVKQWLTKYLNHKFDSVYAAQERNEKERELDNFMMLRGQQVTCDCLHHLNYAMIKGDHIDELEEANRELDKYRAELNNSIIEKASRYNLQLEH